MNQPLGSPIVQEFFADRPAPRAIAASCAGVTIIALLVYLGARHSGYLLRHGQFNAVALSWAFIVMAVLCLPSWARDATEAWRGKPLLRLGERGIWIRDWESVGWIEWADVEAIVNLGSGNDPILLLQLRDKRKYLDRMNWIDRLAWVGGEALSKAITAIASKTATVIASETADEEDRSISLVSRASLNAQWGRLMAALDPILVAHGIPTRDQGPPSSSPVDPTPSALIAQFPNGGPELRAVIAKLVEVDPTMTDEVVCVARGANPAQQDSIGAGLADASKFFATLGAVYWARDADTRIRQAINLADDGTRIGWAHAEAPRPAASKVK